jgi:predicted transcriptional regulator
MLSASATIPQIGKKYRNKLQIANSILKAAGSTPGGLSKTKIMYISFLSYAQVKEYFIFLLENKLLKYSGETEKYALTEKGFKFIKQYEQLTEVVPESVS